MAIRYVTVTTYRCPACQAVIAVNPKPALGSPYSQCPRCRAPITRPWYREWAYLSPAERSGYYMWVACVPLFISMVAAFGTIWMGVLPALGIQAGVAAVALAISFLFLRVRILESTRRTGAAEQPLRDANRGGAGSLFPFIFTCVLGLVVALVALGLIRAAPDVSEGLQGFIKLSVCAGAALLALGLIGLVPAARAAKRYLGLGVIAAWSVAATVALYLIVVAPLGAALPPEELLALLDQSEADPTVRATVAKLGRSSSKTAEVSGSWPQHHLDISTDKGRVSRISFGSIFDKQPYAGTLPYELHTGDQPEQVRAALGAPRWMGDKNQSRRRAAEMADLAEFNWEYPLRGIKVEFSAGRLLAVHVTAPSRLPQAPLGAAAVAQLPGKPRQSPEVQQFIDSMKLSTSAMQEQKMKNYLALQWYARAELRLDDAGTVAAVLFFPDYLGELPAGVHFGDPRDEVKQRLGKASASGTEVDEYLDKGLRIDYGYFRTGIYSVWITQPGVKAPGAEMR